MLNFAPGVAILLMKSLFLRFALVVKQKIYLDRVFATNVVKS